MGSPETILLSSYPPLFRQHRDVQHSIAAEQLIVDEKEENEDIPVVDLGSLDEKQLEKACNEWGIFRLVNHGVPPEVSARLKEHACSLLSFPFETKQQHGFAPPATYFWGTPALAQSVKNVNWVEGFHFTVGNLQQEKGQTPFSSLLYEYGKHMARITRQIFEALAPHFKPNNKNVSTTSCICESEATLRVYRYPPCNSPEEYFGMDAHTDSSVLSILSQDDVGGLQILRNGKWFVVKQVPGTLIVNLGDMMQAISNDEYKSVEHRVVTNGNKERISFCYFAFPPEDSVIQSCNYKAFTYREFKAKVREDVRDFGSKIGLDRFRSENF